MAPNSFCIPLVAAEATGEEAEVLPWISFHGRRSGGAFPFTVQALRRFLQGEKKKKKMNKITRDCQKGGPPTTASKCMIIMKICTSVTSILIRCRGTKQSHKNKQTEKAEITQSSFCSRQLFASSAALLYHAPQENKPTPKS